MSEPATIQQTLSRILLKLERLRQHDQKYQVFGAATHLYRFHPPLPEKTIQDFEIRHQITLPADYRAFMTQVGNGGAGPYYGLLRLEEFDGELHTMSDILLSRPFPHLHAWKPDVMHIGEDAYFADHWMQGTLHICHYGCGIYFLLVVSGEAYGTIWADDRGSDGGIVPWGEHTTFLAWYEQWLDSNLTGERSDE